MRSRAIRGSVWLSAARAVQLGAQLVSLILLARYLDKAAFGLAGMAAVVAAVFGAGADLGMGVLGVQRDEPDERHVARWALAGGLATAALLFLTAPLFAGLFGEGESLTSLLRAAACALPCAGIIGAARARLSRRFAFERMAGLDMEWALVAAAARVGFAMQGYGAWAIVLGDLVGVAVTALGFALVAGRPQPGRTAPLLRDGLHVVGTRLADVLFGQIDRFFVGVRYGTGALGLYTFSYPQAMAVIQHGSPVAEQAALPWLSRVRDAELRDAYATVTRLFALAALPFATLLWVAAPALVDWLYPERWREAVPVLRALAVAAFCAGLNGLPGVVWLALGRMRLRFGWSLANVALLAVALPLFAGDWLLAVPYTLAARSLLVAVATQVMTRRLIGFPHRLYVFCLVPGLIASLGVATLALLFSR
ncbi:MAG: oligosaccharide flippase family protein [Planctomycetota bacterium]